MQMKVRVNVFFVVTTGVLFFLTLLSSAASDGEKQCMICHDSMYNEALGNAFIHRAFLDKRCVICHVEGSVKTTENSREISRHKRTTINWLQNQYEPARTHYFLIPEGKVDDVLFVKSEGKNGRSQTTSISLPPLKQLPQLVNDGQSPGIFDIEFLGVKRGILYSATISWKTDEPSDSQIHYGIGTFSRRTRLDRQFKTRHFMVISPLSPGETYIYSVVSKDLYGNRAISQPLTFSTRIAEPVSQVELVKNNGQSSSETELKHSLSAAGNRYYITISANKPTYMNIGVHRDLRPRIRMAQRDSSLETSAKHVPMKGRYETTIKTCLGCHQDYQNVSNHPIDVLPKKGMIFPKDLPLLANGRMHCMTCHEPHSSRNEARIRRSTKQELCIGCHRDYG